MEDLPGETLRSWTARTGALGDEPEDAALAAAILAEVATALGAAHARGIIYRDLKPENIYLVADPGRPGRVVVQVRGETAPPGGGDARSDLYALGCVLFQLLCGRPPFVHEAAGGLLTAPTSEPPPDVGALAPAVPAPLARLVARLLAKDPAARPQSVAEVIAALEAVLGYARAQIAERVLLPPHRELHASAPDQRPPRPVQTQVAPPARRRRLVWLLPLAMVAALGIVVVARLMRDRENLEQQPNWRNEVTPAQGRPLPADGHAPG